MSTAISKLDRYFGIWALLNPQPHPDVAPEYFEQTRRELHLVSIAAVVVSLAAWVAFCVLVGLAIAEAV